MKNLEKIYTYYTQIQQMNPGAKEKFLAEIKESSPELHQQLLEILKSEDDASLFFDNFEQDVMASLFDHQQYKPGKQIGAYQLQTQIGSGGMAYVFKANRTDGAFDREVAIKFIKRGIDTDEVIKRFQLERNLLAGLNHENIAQLFDGGVTDDGLPYFVMEYIEGDDISQYCKNHNLNLKARLHLFLQICKAVDFAHKNLIVHRDIKPGNILINPNGQAKLTDFGIAKMLDDKSPEGFTRPDMRVMTREYASPEQRSGQLINISSDIYQMGLLLYELLTEKKAWNKEASKHQFDFNNKLIPGELKSIIQTATMEEPELRYNAMEALKNDVENFLENKPVKAQGKSNWYSLRKFIARHKIAVASTIVVLVLATIGLTKYIIDINQARRIADYRTVQANAMANFYLSSFSRQYPTHADGDTLNAFDLLQSIESYIEMQQNTFADELDSIAYFRFYYLMGEIYTGWNQHSQALDKYKKAASIGNNISKNFIEPLYDINEININSAIGLSYLWLGKTDSALYFYKKAIANPGNKNIVQELSGIAYARVLSGDYSGADSVYSLLFNELKSGYIPEQELVPNAVAMGRLGSFYTRYSFNEKKELIDSIFRKSLGIFEQNKLFSNKPSFNVFNTENIKRKSIKVGDKYKFYHPDSYAETINYYGIYLYTDKNYDSALHFFEKAYQANLRYFGKNNLKSLDNLNNMAAIQRNTGSFEEAQDKFRLCWEMSQRNKFIHPAQALNYYQNYAGMYYNLEEYQTCLIAMDTLLQMKKQYAPNDVYSINKAKIIMANCHYELGNYKKAINIYDEIIADHRAAFGNKGNADLEAGMQKILALAEMDLYDKLIKLHAEVKTDIDERMGKDDPFHLQNHKALIKALLTLNRHGEAEELIKKQMEQDLNVEDNFQYRSLLATCYFQQEKIDEAEKIYQQLKNEPDLTLAMTNALENLEKLMNQ